MFPALRRGVIDCAIGLALSVGALFPAFAQASAPGETASAQARHIATYFPGRMTGTPAEMLSADYIRQQFAQWGYQSDIRNARYPKGTGCCNDAEVFDKAGIPVLSVEATNWSLGHKDGYQQRAKSVQFPAGTSWHNAQLDNQQYIDRALPGRIEKRSRDVMRIMLPLVKELAKAGKG